jgi:hypothetical protein
MRSSPRLALATLMVTGIAVVIPLVQSVEHASAANPPSNIPPSPNFNQTCAHGAVDNSTSCIHDAVQAMNNARSQEGLGPIALPNSYPTLSADQQLFVVVNAERVDRGLAPLAGVTTDLDSAAQSGADNRSDPAPSPPGYAGTSWEEDSTEWSGVTQAIGAVYYWMYVDGWGGSAATTYNVDCKGPADNNCWNHRAGLLDTFKPGQNLSFGGAVSPNNGVVFTTILAGTQGGPPPYTYTWSQAQADTPGGSTTTTTTPSGNCTPGSASSPPTGKVGRLAGGNRDETAIAASNASFGAAGSAKVVVLASDANFPDALAGGPLATAKLGPLLITPKSGLTAEVESEIKRVLPSGSVVYVLGGGFALDPSTDTTLSNDGYSVKRLAGQDRFGTAVAIADELGDPGTILEATGGGFADALAAGPAASAVKGAILLTAGSTQSDPTSAYIADKAPKRYAIGGPAATADPGATAIVGGDRYQTALRVTKQFVSTPASLGFATGVSAPDALAGGPVEAKATGGLLLVPPCGSISTELHDYLQSVSGSVTKGNLFGGAFAVGDDILGQLENALA